MKIYIEPSKIPGGGWSLRWEGDSQQLGNFLTADAAEKAVKSFAGDIEIIKPAAETVGPRASVTQSVDQHLAAAILPI